MIPGLRGSLLSQDALDGAFDHRDIGEAARTARRQLAAWHAAVRHEAGPAWPARVVFDRIAVPFCRILGYDVVPSGGDAGACRASLQRCGLPAAIMTAAAWGREPGTWWRQSVRGGIAAGVRWCWCFTGPALRIFDARRTHSRRFVEFDIDIVSDHPAAFAAVWGLLADAAGLDTAVRRSDRHTSSVRASLQLGVHDALGHLTAAFASATGHRRTRRPPDPGRLLDESLVVVYRILFLLFAEARGLVPAWHPVFRDGYTIESLRDPVETQARPRGVWESLQAIARLAHRGCRAGTLTVPPFNGRLFSPSDAPLADAVPLDDAEVSRALLSLTTVATAGGRRRISYADLGVEHLGGVYERVLDYDVEPDGHGTPSLVRGGRRKATGSFYTPRSLTEYLVRRTLAPLVAGAAPDAILSLRVLDPAMGSGAFLVAVCRYLAGAYEEALIADGACMAADLSDADRAGFRRAVAQRCLYGVDLNPMSVQLARLSLWLTTLASDRPLTFFDHHLRCGNSLVGARVSDVRAQQSGRRQSKAPLPLLDSDGLDAAFAHVVSSRYQLRDAVEETLEQVRAKERLLGQLQAPGAPLSRLKEVADLWCAGWFSREARAVNRATFAALVDTAMGRAHALPGSLAERVLHLGRTAARGNRFFHWELEFPEAFHGSDGTPLPRPGFDAVIGNPPWEMLRGDAGDAPARGRAAAAGSALTQFARGSGVYRLQGGGHANLYQLFTERALSLLRQGGRLGLVLPSGFASDHGCAGLRRHVFGTTSIDSFVEVENRERLFPIHRGLRFVLLTLTKGGVRSTPEARWDAAAEAGRTMTLPLRSGIRSPAEFDQLPDEGPDPRALAVPLRLIEQLSGEQFAIPALRTPLDARIAGRIAVDVPAAADEAGWALSFGRELNATEDRRHFGTNGPRGLPVVEGKQVQPFVVDVRSSRHTIAPSTAERVLGRRPFDRPRVAYRDVASSSNRLTLIAAVLPAGVVTTHTLFCLKTPLDEDAQHAVAGLMNSFVANYLVRLRVTTHVTVAIVERLPLPRPARGSADFRLVAESARVLAESPGRIDVQARLQATAARLYRLDAEAFEHVLDTLPLVDPALRAASLRAFIGTV